MWDQYTSNPMARATRIVQRRVNKSVVRLKRDLDEIDVHIDNLRRWGVITNKEQDRLYRKLHTAQRAIDALGHDVLLATEGER